MYHINANAYLIERNRVSPVDFHLTEEIESDSVLGDELDYLFVGSWFLEGGEGQKGIAGAAVANATPLIVISTTIIYSDCVLQLIHLRKYRVTLLLLTKRAQF